MGLFKRSKKDDSDQPDERDQLGPGDQGSDQFPDESMGPLENDQPRCRHYVFAHVALRNVAFEYPVEIIAALGSEKADSLLDDLWSSVEQACSDQEEDDRPIDRSAVKVHRVRIGEYPTAVVQMPEPVGATEAYFTAIVLCVDPNAKGISKDDIKARYFTLEMGAKISPDDSDRTVLCEWTADGSHVNGGDGPAADVGMFCDAIRAKL